MHTRSYWFLQNYLALNAETSDAILRQRNSSLFDILAINVAESTVSLSALPLTKKILPFRNTSALLLSPFYHIKVVCYIRHTLDTLTASLIVYALVSSRLDYAKLPTLSSMALYHIQSPNYNESKTHLLNSNRFTHTLKHTTPSTSLAPCSCVHSRTRLKLTTIMLRFSLYISFLDYLATLFSRYQLHAHGGLQIFSFSTCLLLNLV